MLIQETDTKDPGSQQGYEAEKYQEQRGVTTRSMVVKKDQEEEVTSRSMMVKKDQEEEKPSTSGLFGAVKSVASSAVNLLLGNNKPKEDAMDVDPADPVEPEMEDGEQVAEVQFVSLLESCSEDEIAVR